jgi:aspartate 1-decarboxylase
MRYKEFRYLVEGYPQAQAAFSQVADAESVQKTIADFKQLVSRNQIKDTNQKNIDYWIKQGWDKFNSFVNQAVSVPSKSQVVKKKLPGQSITLVDNDSWFIIIPIDKEASCFHGKDSNWCTTKIHQGHFERYFYKSEITLIYCFNKSTGGMWAIAAHKTIDKMELFDQKDKPLTAEQFTSQTGLNPEELRSMAMGDVHQPRIQANRDKWKHSVSVSRVLLYELPRNTRSAELEKELLYNKSSEECLEYIEKVGAMNGVSSIVKIDGRNFPIAIQIAAINKDPDVFRFIANPVEAVQLAAVNVAAAMIEYILAEGIIPSEKVQVAAVTKAGWAIHYIIKAGITPSEAVQLAAVAKGDVSIGSPIQDIIKAGIKPSEAVQLAAVTNAGYLIEDIIKAGIKPSETVQIAAVTSNPRAIQYIMYAGIKPKESVQIAAVSAHKSAIDFIIHKGIKPKESVQLAAVTKHGDTIKHIIQAGIKPSEAVQLAAVTNDPHLLANIIYQAKIKPSETVQLAAVERDGAAIFFIIELAKIIPSEAVQLAAASSPSGSTAISFLDRAGITPSPAVMKAAEESKAAGVQ